jgi:hypothetical protein
MSGYHIRSPRGKAAGSGAGGGASSHSLLLRYSTELRRGHILGDFGGHLKGFKAIHDTVLLRSLELFSVDQVIMPDVWRSSS